MFQAAAPACTELETIVLDWLGKMINLPDDFLSCKKGSKGGGVIQVSRKSTLHVMKDGFQDLIEKVRFQGSTKVWIS